MKDQMQALVWEAQVEFGHRFAAGSGGAVEDAQSSMLPMPSMGLGVTRQSEEFCTSGAP